MQLDIFAAPAGSSGKTFQAPSAATKGATLLSWLARWQDSTSMSPRKAGARKAWRSVSAASSSGACWTRSGSEWRSGAAACSLSSILETGPIDLRYFLSPTACAGILRRAENRGKALPEALQRALAVADGVERVRGELARMGIRDDELVICSNLELRLDGFPRSGQREPADPGIVVYWRDAGATRCMAIDRYDRVADNLAAVAATLEAMRAIERHGGAEILNRAFTGFTALPAPGGTAHWRDILDPANPEGSYRRLRGLYHPDRGGDADEFRAVQHAWDAYQQEQRQ